MSLDIRDTQDTSDLAPPHSSPPTQAAPPTATAWTDAVSQAAATPLQHQIVPGETMGALAARYGVPLQALAAANPATTNLNLIHPGQLITIPASTQPGQQPAQPSQQTVRPGDTLGAIAARNNIPLTRLADANGIANPNHLQAGQILWIPKSTHAAPPAAPTTTTALPAPQTHPAPSLAAQTTPTPTPAQPVTPTPATPSPADQSRTLLAAATASADPQQQTAALGHAYAQATLPVRAALLANPAATRILTAAASWANQPLTGPTQAGLMPQATTREALTRLDHITTGLPSELAGRIAEAAAPAYQAYATGPNASGASPVGPAGIATLMNIAGRIAPSPAGQAAIARFAATGAWNTDAVRNAIAGGADPAYAIGVGQQIAAAHQSPSTVAQTITDGLQQHSAGLIAAGASPAGVLDVAHRMQAAGMDPSGAIRIATNGVAAFTSHTEADVKALATHDSELAWLAKQDGAGLSQPDLQKAVAGYLARSGPQWTAQNTALQHRLTTDGTALIAQMAALGQAPTIPGKPDSARQAMQAVAQNPSASLAISSAISSNPALASGPGFAQAADLFTGAKLGDVGRKFTGELASAYVRSQVIGRLQGTDLANPASVDHARDALRGLKDARFASLLGVTQSDLGRAVTALDTAAGRAAAHPDQADAALADLDHHLNTDAALSKAFNKTTLPGQLLRGAGVAFAGIGLFKSAGAAARDPANLQNDAKALVDAAGFAQKGAELLNGVGAIDRTSTLGKFGGEWRLAGRATAGDLLGGVSALLDGVSAVRSGFGLGVPKDPGAAAFTGTSAVGGALAVAPAFGAAAWLGPVGLGLVAVGVVGGAIYQDVKAAHQNEGASRNFLQDAGYSPTAAAALAKRDGVTSGAAGAAQMPFLARYAEMRGLSPTQIKTWVNSLTPDQQSQLSGCLLQTAGDAHGKPASFTAGPPTTTTIATGDGFPVTLTLSNSLSAFESNLRSSHVPLP